MNKRIRDYGITPGFMTCGPRNLITDVPGVKVGQVTIQNEKHNTGVTVIIPRENIYKHRCTAASWVLNGYGKSAGLVQIDELGQLETPIGLTNTLCTGRVWDALVQYTIDEEAKLCREVKSVNPVVGECNDSTLNTIAERVVGEKEVFEAIENASDDFEQGAVGAGTGMTCHDLKGGIGSASRLVRIAGKTYTVGVLTLCNHGVLRELTVCGKKIGPAIMDRQKSMKAQEEHGEQKEQEEYEAREEQEVQRDKGSCMMILATDLPLSSRQLRRVIKRCGVGLARCGSYWGPESGDVAIGFTTAADIRRTEEKAILELQCLNEDLLEPVFQAAAEATEEAVLNALVAADTTTGPTGVTRHSLREYEDLLNS